MESCAKKKAPSAGKRAWELVAYVYLPKIIAVHF